LDVGSLVGETLTKKFSSAEDAKRLKIVRFDEDTATLREFEVAEEDGLWSLPSKDGYPADATRQMAEATLSLKDRKILAVVGENPGEHEQYGVIDPLSPKLVPGQKGVGARVTLSDSNGDALVDLIIGKARKDAEGQRYVREANRDAVYVIEIDPAKLSTDFEDWIEKDLLKLDAFDLQQVQIKDYSAQLVLAGIGPDGRPDIGIELDPRADITLALDDKGSQWKAVSLKEGQPSTQSYVEFQLAEDEELNQANLNKLKTALDDLKVVDVLRKPQGLSNDLKAGDDFLNNRETLQDLMKRGFTAMGSEGGAPEIISSDGEVIATMKDGTEYVLRFGNLTDAAESDDKEKADETEAAANPSDSLNRYLFVMARFNENAVKKPETQPLPELPSDEPVAATEPAATEPTTDEAATDAKPESENAAATDSAPESDNGAAASEENTDSTDEATATDAAEATPSVETAAESEDKPAAPEDKPAAEAAGEADQQDKQKEIEKVIAERKRIETENQQKLDAYQADLKKGQEKVKDLNLRFGDWYFVIANDEFNKVRLGRDSIIKKKEAKDAAAAGASTTPASPAGAPGTTIPGLPEIPGTGE
jgi:hypothetical protein